MLKCFPIILVGCALLVACGKRDNASGTYAEDGKEIAKTGNFQGQETHGYVGTTDEVGSTKLGTPASNSTSPN